jgi:hypothetical protein
MTFILIPVRIPYKYKTYHCPNCGIRVRGAAFPPPTKLGTSCRICRTPFRLSSAMVIDGWQRCLFWSGLLPTWAALFCYVGATPRLGLGGGFQTLAAVSFVGALCICFLVSTVLGALIGFVASASIGAR